MIEGNKYIIAIDFDNTLCIGQNFPEIGEPRKWLIEKAKQWKKDGHKLILWTCRENVYPGDLAVYKTRNYLDEAVEWCKNYGLEFDAVNKSTIELTLPKHKFSRKIFANFYIDDSSVIFDDKNQTLRKIEYKVFSL